MGKGNRVKTKLVANGLPGDLFDRSAVLQEELMQPRKSWWPCSGRSFHRLSFGSGVLAIVGTVLTGLVFSSLEAHAFSAPRPDDVAMAMVFSFREASQVHLLAHALGTAALNSTPPDEVIKHCDRAIQSYEAVSIPMLGKYLTNVDHDPETRETFRQIQEMQRLALAEVQAIRAMAESGNGQAERLAFVEANRAYNATVQPLTARMVNPVARGDGGEPDEPVNGRLIKSPDRRVFSDEMWTAIAEEVANKGFVRDPSDANKFFGTFGLLKLVFVEKDIPDPSVKQLFGLAKVLTVAFNQMTPEKLETTLFSILKLAKETGTEVASRQALLEMGEE